VSRPSGRAGSVAGTPDDPTGLIGQVLEMGAEFDGHAEDILLSWALSLPREMDAGAAASRLLDAYGLREGPVPAGPIGRIWQLLREAARHPDPRSPGRRGGRTGRRVRAH
jgi:hypothetical protein